MGVAAFAAGMPAAEDDADATPCAEPDAAVCPAVAPGPSAPAGSSVNSNSSKPSKSSASVTNAVLAGTAAGAPEPSADEAAASFRAASKRSGSLVPRRLSGSINSSVESSVPAFRDPAGAEPPWGEGAAPTDAPSSMGASTGRSESGSKTGREAASIISSLVDASSNANLRSAEQARLHGRVPKPVAFDALPLSKQCRGAVASRWLTQRSVGAPECDASHALLATLCPSRDRPAALQSTLRAGSAAYAADVIRPLRPDHCRLRAHLPRRCRRGRKKRPRTAHTIAAVRPAPMQSPSMRTRSMRTPAHRKRPLSARRRFLRKAPACE
jgi:hypothetical protein